MTSDEWRQYYEHNAQSLLEIPWGLGAELTDEEKRVISGSLKAFQAGESSEGRHLFKYAQAYAQRVGDLPYIAAIRLFIAEEQRHARDLGRFLTLNGIALVKTTFTDTVFRKMRNLLASLELSIAVLITAEIIAKVYYAALREATGSQILRRLCDQILSDEQRHVEFQSEQLTKLRKGRAWPLMMVTMGLQRFLYLGTTTVVWLAHRKTLARGGYSAWRWWRESWREFNGAFAPAPQSVPIVPAVVEEQLPTVG